MTQKQADKAFNIPRSTIINKLKGTHQNRIGRPAALTIEEENIILNRVQLMCEYGFPATTHDMQHYIQAYINTRKM